MGFLRLTDETGVAWEGWRNHPFGFAGYTGVSLSAAPAIFSARYYPPSDAGPGVLIDLSGECAVRTRGQKHRFHVTLHGLRPAPRVGELE